MEPLDIRPVSPIVGAEVHGLDLASGVDDDTFAAIHQAFLDHGVLFFRDQSPLAPEAQVSFAKRLGPLHTHPAAPGEGEASAVFVIHSHRHSQVANGNGWHTDVSCQPKPPMATMLQIHQLPEGGGGDTLFANAEAAYAALPEEDRRKLQTMVARHESEHVYRGRYADRGVDDANVDYPSCDHPVVRTHPETGRPSLYLNRGFTRSIHGVDTEHGQCFLEQLLDHIERPEFQIRFTWQQNDIALWDNRCLLHFAIWDYWPNERKGNRVSVLGDEPFFDPTAPDPPPSPIRISGGGLTTTWPS